MKSRSDISRVFERIDRLAQNLRIEDAQFLIDALNELSRIIETTLEKSNGAKRPLRQIAKYLKKKADVQSPNYLRRSESSIRHVRNLLAHNRYVDEYEVRDVYPVFWQILSKTGKEWELEELNNLLAYSLRVKPLGLGHGASSARIVNYYKSYFNALPDEGKAKIFRDLLLRTYSQPPFRRFVEQSSAAVE